MLDSLKLLQRLLMQPDSNYLKTKSEKESIENMIHKYIIHTILLSLDREGNELKNIFLPQYNQLVEEGLSGVTVSESVVQRYSDPSSTTRTAFLSLFGDSSQLVENWLDNTGNMDSIKATLPSGK